MHWCPLRLRVSSKNSSDETFRIITWKQWNLDIRSNPWNTRGALRSWWGSTRSVLVAAAGSGQTEVSRGNHWHPADCAVRVSMEKLRVDLRKKWKMYLSQLERIITWRSLSENAEDCATHWRSEHSYWCFWNRRLCIKWCTDSWHDPDLTSE